MHAAGVNRRRRARAEALGRMPLAYRPALGWAGGRTVVRPDGVVVS